MKVLSVFLTTLVPAAIAFADAPVPSDPFYSDADGYTGTRTLATLVSSSSTGTNPDYGYTKPYSWGGVTLTDDYDCLVTSNKTIYVMSAERVFPGHSLQIGTTDNYADKKKSYRGVFFDYCHPDTKPFEITGDLIFVNGELKFRYVDSTVIKAGKVSVLTPKAYPLQIYPNTVVEGDRGKTTSLRFEAPVAAPATAGMRIYQDKPKYDVALDVTFAGDMSGYLGDISVETVADSAAASGRTATALKVCDTTIPGSVTMNEGTTLSSQNEGEPFGIGDLTLKAGSVLELSGDVTVNNLVLEGGAKIVVTKPLSGGNVPKLTATGSASISGGTVEIVVSGYEAVADGLTAGLLVVPQDSDITEADIVITDASYDGRLVNAGRKTLVPDETTETKSVAYVYDPIVSMEVSDASDRANEKSSALTNSVDGVHSEQWSDGLLPHAGVHYRLVGTDTSDVGTMKLRSYDSKPVASANVPSLDYTFPGESLTLDRWSSLLLYGRTFTCGQVCVMNKNIQICGAIYGPSTLDAPLYLAPGSQFSSLLYINSLFTFGGEISGSGAMTLTGHKGSSSSRPGCAFCLPQLNTNFTGAITVTITVDFSEGAKTKGGYTPEFDPAGNRFATLYVNDGRNLGGPTAPANPKAVTLQNMSRLAVRDAKAVTIDEPTRGIFVNWCGRFYVPEADETLTLKSPLAVYGEVHKEGDGLLVLANPQPTFGKAATGATPDADATNRMFVVDGGNVKVASAYALNGLDIVSVNDASRFVLDADTEDVTLATYGLIDTLTPGTPFAVDGTATKVAFAVTVAEKPEWEEKEVALCTVKATDAAAVAAVICGAKVDNVGKVRIRSIEQVPTTLGGVDCVTFKATVTGPQGLMLLLR